MTITQEQPTQAQPIPVTLYIAEVSHDAWRARGGGGPARVTNYPDRLAIDVHKSAAEADLEGTIRAIFDQLNIHGSRFAEEFEVIVTDEELVGERAAMLITENGVSSLVINRDGLTDCSTFFADLLLSDIGSMLDKAARGHLVSQSAVCATSRMEYPPRPKPGPCPPWCELPTGHAWDDELAGRAHTLGVFASGLLRLQVSAWESEDGSPVPPAEVRVIVGDDDTYMDESLTSDAARELTAGLAAAGDYIDALNA